MSDRSDRKLIHVIPITLLLCMVVALVGCQRLGGPDDEIDPVVAPDAGLSLRGQLLLPADLASGTNASIATQTAAIDAHVWIEELPNVAPVRTDASGTYVFVGLPPGQFRVVARLILGTRHFMVRSQPIAPQMPTVANTVPSQVLGIASRIVSGILRDSAGTPLASGTVVTVFGERFTVGAGGSFVVGPLPDAEPQAEIVVQVTVTLQQSAPSVADRPRVLVPLSGSSGVVTVDVQVAPTGAANPPVQATVAATKDGVAISRTNRVQPGDSILIKATPANVETIASLTYSWDAGRGTFASVPGNSDSATWIAPASAGPATVTMRLSAPGRGFCQIALPLDVVAVGGTDTGAGSGTGTGSGTSSGTGTQNSTGTGTGTPASTGTGSSISTGTATATSTGVLTATGTAMTTGTATATSTGVLTATGTAMTTGTGTTTATGTVTATATGVDTATSTATATETATATATGSGTSTATSTGTQTSTGTGTATSTGTGTGTAAASYTVLFDVRGGTAIASQTVASGAVLAAPTPPTRTNHVFGGWFRESTLTTPWNFATDRVATDVTLFARWSLVQYTVSYLAGANGSLTGTATQLIEHGASGTAITAVPVAGYRFVVWSDARTDNPRTDTSVTANATVTATFAAISAGVAAANKSAWSENAGWLNFGDSNGSATAVLGAGGSLSGYAWGENIGWIKLAGTAGSGVQYGVNINGAGNLSGYAWSENAGWLNFGATNGNAAIDLATGALSGFVWSESLGWIKLAGTAGSGAAYGVRLSMPN